MLLGSTSEPPNSQHLPASPSGLLGGDPCALAVHGTQLLPTQLGIRRQHGQEPLGRGRPQQHRLGAAVESHILAMSPLVEVAMKDLQRV